MTRLTICFLFLFSLISSYAQEEVNYSNLRSLRDGESFIRFQVMELGDSKKVNLKEDVVYSWFKSQKVMSTEGGASGVLLDGIYEEFYPNSQLKVKGVYKKGVKHGRWMYWKEDGQLLKKVYWRNGDQIKDAVTYSDEGKVLTQEDFSANKKTYYYGDKIIHAWKDSTEVEVIHKYENGQTKRVERYENDSLDGRQLKYSPNGELIYLKSYKNGQLHGKQIDKEGNKTYFKNGEPHQPLLKRIFNKDDKSEELESEEKEKKNKKKENQDESEKD